MLRLDCFREVAFSGVTFPAAFVGPVADDPKPLDTAENLREILTSSVEGITATLPLAYPSETCPKHKL